MAATIPTFSVTGTTTGKRYDVRDNSYINTRGSGESYFPGSTAGTTQTGGRIDSAVSMTETVKQIHTGFTQLGDVAPAIKHKKLTGTTAATEARHTPLRTV